MKNALLALFAATMLAGCQSSPLSEYTSPKVTGRVVAADTHQTLAGVRITRVEPFDPSSDSPPKGGQVMEQAAPVKTGADGSFAVASQSDISLFQHDNWYSVTLNFAHEGYQSFQTTYTITDVTTNSPDGKPWIKAGDIVLQPVLK